MNIEHERRTRGKRPTKYQAKHSTLVLCFAWGWYRLRKNMNLSVCHFTKIQSNEGKHVRASFFTAHFCSVQAMRPTSVQHHLQSTKTNSVEAVVKMKMIKNKIVACGVRWFHVSHSCRGHTLLYYAKRQHYRENHTSADVCQIKMFRAFVHLCHYIFEPSVSTFLDAVNTVRAWCVLLTGCGIAHSQFTAMFPSENSFCIFASFVALATVTFSIYRTFSAVICRKHFNMHGTPDGFLYSIQLNWIIDGILDATGDGEWPRLRWRYGRKTKSIFVLPYDVWSKIYFTFKSSGCHVNPPFCH